MLFTIRFKLITQSSTSMHTTLLHAESRSEAITAFHQQMKDNNIEIVDVTTD